MGKIYRENTVERAREEKHDEVHLVEHLDDDEARDEKQGKKDI